MLRPKRSSKLVPPACSRRTLQIFSLSESVVNNNETNNISRHSSPLRDMEIGHLEAMERMLVQEDIPDLAYSQHEVGPNSYNSNLEDFFVDQDKSNKEERYHTDNNENISGPSKPPECDMDTVHLEATDTVGTDYESISRPSPPPECDMDSVHLDPTDTVGTDYENISGHSPSKHDMDVGHIEVIDGLTLQVEGTKNISK